MVPSWHQKRTKKAGSELGRGFGVRSPIGRRSSEGIGRTESSPARLSSYILPTLAAGPWIHSYGSSSTWPVSL